MMATFKSYKRVKAKKPWEKVVVPEDLFNSEGFEGLIDLQVLTDYDLVDYDADSSEESSIKTPKKRKQDNDSDDLSDEPIKKKKKKGSLKGGEQLNESDDEDFTIDKIASTTDGKKKKKKKKGKDLCDSDIPEPNTKQATKKGEIISSADVELVEGVIPEIKMSKKAAKKNKNKLQQLGSNDKSEVVNTKITQEKETSSESVSKKKKKKNLVVSLKEDSEEDGGEEGYSSDELVWEEEDEEEEEEEEKDTADIDMSQWANLYVPEPIMEALTKLKFDKPTVIQTLALPAAIRDRRDILGAAETGSGKTLAFGIPVLSKVLAFNKRQKLEAEDNSNEDEEESEDEKVKKQSKANHPLVLILEPTRELAVQVKNHLQAIACFTDIRMVNIVGGMSIEKQRRILLKKPEIVIATPGRLWQLFEEGNEHILGIDRVVSLVIDEADRMVEKGHYEELTKILELMNKSEKRDKRRQTFVMSATLTMEVAAPRRLYGNKKVERKLTQDDKLKSLQDRICVGLKPKIIDLTPKDNVSQTLTELRVNCKADEKDLYLYYFLCQHPGRTLVFANSKDCLRRLNSLFTLLACNPLPLHADMHQRQRLKNLDKFAANSKGLLIASDVAARGLDIPKVDHVLHYQVPRTMENYIHRSGRTARASQLGLSVMLVGPEEAKNYRKIIQGVRNGDELPLMPVEMELIPAVRMRMELARKVDVTEYRLKKKKMRNNFFTKAAEDMDMILDDRNLLVEMGDFVEQNDEKHQMRAVRAELASALRGSLAPMRMSKYPTKLGKLITKQKINLHSSS